MNTEIFDDGLCGDCIDGRCHWGSATPSGSCGCDRHDASVRARTDDDALTGDAD